MRAAADVPLWQRFLMLAMVDAGVIIASLGLAYLIRFDGHVPPAHAETLFKVLPLLLSVRLVSAWALGLHRWSFRMAGLAEAVTVVVAVALGSAVMLVADALWSGLDLPRSILVLEFLLTSALWGAVRFLPRQVAQWYLESQRRRGEGFVRTLIIGAGSAGDLLLRDLQRSGAHSHYVVGFVDDDPAKQGTSLGGKPVVGKIDDLARLVVENDVSQVLIAIPRLGAERIRWILRQCATLKVSFKIIPASFVVLDRRVSAAMLHDLSPEDLLPRDQVAFDQEEIREMVAGRRVLVTGAAGSIGSEISRQVASHGPAELVLVDINENELYFLVRRLQELHPALKLHSLIADIRDADRMLQLGRRFQPQYVFHAAAHKHVPLMEDAPEEAVKNNIFGTFNVAQMAHQVGAERMVLISTDKAVRPSSVMGVTKRVAELVIRDLAQRSHTRFTAVRFGNVLGSAGSVVPLFKQQIARGGPVTITHPECSRYFMTIPEACGLVVLAGLGGYGDLCILDMGEPIRIAELASNMITMAGLIPGKDIPIVFTGLRPGEKLTEELLTEEEETTRQVRNRILLAKSPLPPADLAEHLARLAAAARTGESMRVRQLLQQLVPTYVEPKLPKLAPAQRAAEGEPVNAAALAPVVPVVAGRNVRVA